MINLLTFDIEDWYHPNLVYNNSTDVSKYEDRVVAPTLRILNMLAETNNRATFFVLGEVAEKFPEIVQEIVRQGHEVGSHGYCHNLIYNYTKYQFETDINKSVKLLENVTNQKVLGYRAPSWSLNEKTPWAWDVLNAFGLEYDSSMYPYRTFLFGNNTSPRFDYEIELTNGEKIKEIPPSAAELLNKRIPFAGGFFLRMAPLWYVDLGISQYNKLGKPAVIYLHPWEIDVGQPRLPMSKKDRFITYTNLNKTEGKLQNLLKKYKFESIKTYIESIEGIDNSSSKILTVNEVA